MVRASICWCLPTKHIWFLFIHLFAKKNDCIANEWATWRRQRAQRHFWKWIYLTWKFLLLNNSVTNNCEIQCIFIACLRTHTHTPFGRTRLCNRHNVWCGFVCVAQLTLDLMTELVRDWSIFGRFMNFHKCSRVLSVALNSEAILFSIGVFFSLPHNLEIQSSSWMIYITAIDTLVCVYAFNKMCHSLRHIHFGLTCNENGLIM